MINEKLAVYEIIHLFKLIDELDVLEKHWYEMSQSTFGFSIDLGIAELRIREKEQVILDTIRAFKFVNEPPKGESNDQKIDT